MKYYGSPRITSEYADCSMPVTFDQYSNCGYNCAYCFSQYIRGVGPASTDYDAKQVSPVNVERVKKIFTGKIKTGYWSWIKAKKPVQWGGLSDPFCPIEEKQGKGLELLRFFNEIKYPISFSSKSDLILRDKRYLDEFKKAGDRWHYKASIITTDEEKAKLIEDKVPTPLTRIKVLKTLHEEAGTLTTWRMRPYIIGVTDEKIKEMVKTAKEIGCQSITTEFFCLEMRSLGRELTLNNFKKISKAAQMSLIKLYKKHGKGAGYIRLKYDFVKPYVKEYVDLCKKYKLPYFVSDASHKDKCCSGSCCGLLNNNQHFKGYAKYQMAQLLQKAKSKGTLTIQDAEDITDEAEKEWRQETHVEEFMNLGSGCGRHKRRKMTYQDDFMSKWNGNYFERYFDGLIKKQGQDKNGNAIYFYDYKKGRL